MNTYEAIETVYQYAWRISIKMRGVFGLFRNGEKTVWIFLFEYIESVAV